MSQMETLFSLLVLLLLPHPSWLYSLQNCTRDSREPGTVDCRDRGLVRIPSDISRPAVFLQISGNKIESIRQNDFSAFFTELQVLGLSFNQISHIKDAAFLHLSSLTKLSLDYNNITTLTDDMFTGLCNLTVLTVAGNKIKHISEFAFAPLTKLLELNLKRNALSSTRDIVKVSLCPLLKSLDLSLNPLTLFDTEHFPFPLNVTALDLQYTPLSKFTLHSDVLPHLQTLHLSYIDNEFQWDVSDKAFAESLRTLSLYNTNFSDETYEIIFQSLDSLELLDFGKVHRALDRGLLDRVCGIQTLQKIVLNRYNISVLNDSLLLLCSNLTDLDLSLNALSDLGPSSLRMLTRLSRLKLKFNNLTKVPLTIRNLSSLTSLSFYSNNIRKISCLDFSGLRLLTVLDLSYNKIRELNSCVFQDLQSLQELNIGTNFILDFADSFAIILPNMLILQAADNSIVRLQKGVFRNMMHLTDLDLHYESAKVVSIEQGAFDGLTDLINLSIYLLDIIYLPSADVGGHTQLQQVFNLPSLQTLSITFANKDCVLLQNDFFQGLDDLKVLSWKSYYLPPHLKIFCHTPHLLHLQMTNYDEWFPDAELFHPLTVLQTLDLSESHLKSVDFLSEANLTQLHALILQNNDLSVINESVFEAIPALRHLDLSGNPFVCHCANADFILWAIRDTQVYVSGAFQYRCAAPESHQGELLLQFDVLWCWESVGFFCFICSSALVLLTLLPTFLHHFLRFHLLYSLYLLRAKLYHRQKMRRGCAETYDAFVSYNVHDEEWVYRELLPELEGRQGWKLCLHHRDFEPGKAILENITDAIYSSRKTLCVISQQYLLSEWCSREIQMASYRLLDEQKDVLILLFLEELSSNQLSPFFRMRKLLRSRTYLSWSGARSHRGLFWERVHQALQSGAQLEPNPLPTAQ